MGDNHDDDASSRPDTEPETGTPHDKKPSDEASLEDLTQQAKRTHELVDAVDLKKVASHDKAELSKVASVKNALGELERGGQVDYVEGVDEVIAQLDPDQQRRADLLTHLHEQGWDAFIGRVLACSNASDSELKPLDLIPHREGLPEFDVCLAPNEGSGSGNFGLFVSASGIFAATIGEPVTKHHWHIVHSRPYENMAELDKSLSHLRNAAFE